MRAHVGGHDDDRVAEIHRPALVVGKAPVVQYLEQDVEDVGVGLLDLVEQHHRVGFAADRFGELAPFVVADVSGRRSDEPRYGVSLLVFAHVDAREHVLVVEEELRQCFRKFGFAHARSAEEDERADRASRILQSGPRTAHGIGHRRDGLVLAHHASVQLRFQVEQLGAFAFEHAADGNARPFGHYLGDVFRIHLLFDHGAARGVRLVQLVLQEGDLFLRFAYFAVAYLGHQSVFAVALGLDGLLAELFNQFAVLLYLVEHPLFGLPFCPHFAPAGVQFVDLVRELLDAFLVALAADAFAFDLQLAHLAVERVDLLRYGVHFEPQPCCRLVHQVDGFVGQEARGDVAVGELHGRHDRLVFDAYLVVVLVPLLQAAQNGDRVEGGRFVDHHLLETSFQCLVLFEILLVFVEGGRTDGAQFTPCEGRLENVGSIHGTLTLTGAYKGMYLVDEKEYLALGGGNLLDDGLEPLLELALVFRTGYQCAHVERENLFAAQVFGYVAVHDAAGDTLCDGGFAHTRLADEDRVVLGPARKNLEYAAYLFVAADHGIEFPGTGHFVQVDGVLAQGVEYLFGGLAVDGASLAELLDRRDELLLRHAAPLEQLGRLAPVGHEAEEQVLHRGELVGEDGGVVHRLLDRTRRGLRKVVVAAARYLRECVDAILHGAAERLYVHPDPREQVGVQRIVFGDERREDVHRFDSLVGGGRSDGECRLQGLLCFNGQCVDIHISVFVRCFSRMVDYSK